MSGVLVLNASYEPLHIVSVRRALVLLLKEKAELVEAAERTLRSVEEAHPWPLVIRLVSYVRIPQRLTLPLNRRNVFIRDEFTCQYCGRQPGRAHLTMDHVIPRSRGGAALGKHRDRLRRVQPAEGGAPAPRVRHDPAPRPLPPALPGRRLSGRGAGPRGVGQIYF